MILKKNNFGSKSETYYEKFNTLRKYLKVFNLLMGDLTPYK